MGRNISDDGDMFKETKLLMYSSRGNHGSGTKTDMFYATQLILSEVSETFCCSSLLISQSHKNFWQDQILFLNVFSPPFQ